MHGIRHFFAPMGCFVFNGLEAHRGIEDDTWFSMESNAEDGVSMWREG
jgi:hypothetical protein